MTTKIGKKRIQFHHHKHANYGRILNSIRDEYLAGGKPERLAVPYILMCATTLEARLNDELHGYASKTWKDNYKSIADAYLSMSFRGKLNALVPILTNNQYRINHEHTVYQRLASLVTVRNLLAHPKPTVGEFEVEESPDAKTWPFPYPQIPQHVINTFDDLTMGATQTFSPVEYHDAVEKLEKWFFHRCPDRLSKIVMVIKREDA
jgi:hypothetical protein